MRQVLSRQPGQVFRLAWPLVVVEQVEAHAGVWLPALGNQRQGRVQTGAERVRATELEGKPYIEPGRPLGRLGQRDNGAAEVRGVRAVREVGNDHECRHAERLAKFQSPAEVVEMRSSLFTLREEKAPLVSRRDRPDVPVRK